MISQRVYSRQACLNPRCTRLFNPYDKRQNFHDAQCRVNYHNDKRNFLAGIELAMQNKLTINEWILDGFWYNPNYRDQIVIERNLVLLNFDFTIGVWHKNIDSNAPVLWFEKYGLEMILPEFRIFEIHKRTK